MSAGHARLEEAVALARQGQREAARELLLDIVRETPRDEQVWLWLARTYPERAARVEVLEACLKVNPHSRAARQALDRLHAPPLSRPKTFPWRGVLLGIGALLCLSAVCFGGWLIARDLVIAPPVALPPTATPPPPTLTPTLTPLPPTATPSTPPPPTGDELLERWGPPLTYAQALSTTCDGLISLAETVTHTVGAPEYDLALGMALGMLAQAEGRAALDAWTPPQALAGVQGRLLHHQAALEDAIGQWTQGELAPDEVAALLRETCAATRATASELRSAASASGVTVEWLAEMATSAQRQAELSPAMPDPTALGASRRNPFPAGGTAIVPGWNFQARDVVRGEAAWARIADNALSQPPPPGYEYLLVRLVVRNTTTETLRRPIQAAEFSATGDRAARYPHDPFALPGPALDAALPGGREAGGWLAFAVAEGEGDLLLAYQPGGTGAPLYFLALDEDAAVPIPQEFHAEQATMWGATPEQPLYRGEPGISRDWAVAFTELFRGADAWARIEAASPFNTPPPPGREYLLLHIRARLISPWERTAVIDARSFSTSANPDGWPPAIIAPEPALEATLFSGGEATGWIVLDVPVGQEVQIIFHPYSEVTDINRRYFSLDY